MDISDTSLAKTDPSETLKLLNLKLLIFSLITLVFDLVFLLFLGTHSDDFFFRGVPGVVTYFLASFKVRKSPGLFSVSSKSVSLGMLSQVFEEKNLIAAINCAQNEQAH